MTETDWRTGTLAVTNFEIDVVFLTNRDFYFGDDNSPEQIADKKNFTEPLYIPFADKDLLVTANNIKGNFDELIKYYQCVLTLAKRHGKTPSQYYFWIRPIIRNLETEKVLVGFPWYDTLNEIRRLFSELKKESEGNLFFDADQSWQLTIDNFGGRVFIKECDPDDDEVYCQISLERQEMVRQLNEVLTKTERIVNSLTSHFGTDYWTKRL